MIIFNLTVMYLSLDLMLQNQGFLRRLYHGNLIVHLAYIMVSQSNITKSTVM